MSTESNSVQDGQNEQTNNQQPSLFSMFSNITRLAYQPVDLPAVEGLVQSLTSTAEGPMHTTYSTDRAPAAS